MKDGKRSSKKAQTGKAGPGEARFPFLEKLVILAATFMAGMSVMVIEIAANRILAPLFGNTLYTWTSLIGIILLALSVGYYLGGWLADRRQSFLLFFHLLGIAAVLVFLIPMISDAQYGEMIQMNMKTGPIAASILLFALPGILLGSVSPYAIRLMSLLHGDKKIGVSAGTIAMFSTLGSVLGTFGAGYVLIPHLRLSSIFFIIASTLMFLSILGYIVFSGTFFNRTVYGGTSLLLVILLAAVADSSSHGSRPPAVLLDKTTFYHRIRVLETAEPDGKILRTLMLDTTREGARYMNSDEIPMPYQRYWVLSKALFNRLDRAAFLGAGSFTMPQEVSKAFEHATVDVVEIDPEVIEAGYRFFDVGRFENIEAVSEDARRFLFKARHRYDLIFGDAYNGVRYIPGHLLTLEFFQLVEKRLRKEGVFMINMISSVRGPDSVLFQSVVKTLQKVFDHIDVFALAPGHLASSQNIIIVASDTKRDIGKITSATAESAMRRLLNTHLPEHRYEVTDGLLLTDDYNPVEHIIARTL